MSDLRDVLLEAINLDNSQCDLPINKLIKKVAAERKDLVQSWGDSNGNHGTALVIEEENVGVIEIQLEGGVGRPMDLSGLHK